MTNTKQLQAHPDAPFRVLMICMGNICRSPTAHGVFEKQVQDAGLTQIIEVDSAGTHSYHVGEPPDKRSQAHAIKRGYDLSTQRARKLVARDFTDFDLLLVMDDNNESAARAICPPGMQHKLQRLTDYCSRFKDNEVPDPYYGGSGGFEHVLDLVEDACAGVLAAITSARKAD